MSDGYYTPSGYLVRLIALDGNGNPVSAMTVDDSDNAETQDRLQAEARRVVVGELLRFSLLDPEPLNHRYEVLTGATVNRLAKMEDLLNACRNVLIDFEAADMSNDTRRVYGIVMAELDAMLGID